MCRLTSGVLDSVEVAAGADQQTALGDRRGRHAHLVQAVFPKHLVFSAGLDHIRVTVFAEAKDLAVVGPGAGGEGVGFDVDALLAVDFFSRLGIVAGEEAAIEQRVIVVAVEQRRGIVGARLGLEPGDVFVTLLAGL